MGVRNEYPVIGNLFRYNGIEGNYKFSPILYNYPNTSLVCTERDAESWSDHCIVRDEIWFGFRKEGSLMNRTNLGGKEESWM